MPNAVKGALWMVAAAAALTAMAMCIRLVPGYSVLLLIFLRNAIILVLLAPSIARQGRDAVRTSVPWTHALRNFFLYSGNVAWFYGVTQVPMAEVASLQFTSPLFTALIAAAVLGERFGGHRLVAILVGILGAAVIIRPGMVPVNAGTLAVLAAAFLYSCAFVVTKRLSGTESGTTVVFYMSVTILVYSAIPAFLVWETPAVADLPAIVGIGVTGYATHYCVTRSMANADASFVAPFDFMRLPFSAAVGWVLFRESVDVWTVAGALMIFAAGYYSTLREARAARLAGNVEVRGGSG